MCTAEAILQVVIHTYKLLSCLIEIDSFYFSHGIRATGLRKPVP